MQELQFVKAEHRKILLGEVVFDVDTHLRVLSDRIHDYISARLIEDGLFHQVWDTSRSPHIHLFFEGMQYYPKDVRRELRILIMRHYSGKYFSWIDKAKASEDVMIREFRGLHEITGKPKMLIYEHWPDKSRFNAIPGHILEQLRSLHSLGRIEAISARDEAYRASGTDGYKEFLDFCLKTRFSQDGRRGILFKNIAIAAYRLGYSRHDMQRVAEAVARNCVGRRAGDIVGWYDWVSNKKSVHVHWGELRDFYVKTHAD